MKKYKTKNYLENYLSDLSQKNLLLKTGVYKISFVGTNNFYIGSSTENFKGRFRRHLSDLERDRHCNNILTKAFKKYGKPIFSIVEICDKAKCLEREQYYIDNWTPKYNICKIAGNTSGIKPSKKQLEKTSIKIDVFDLNGVFLNTYSSIAETSRKLNIHSTRISKIVKEESGKSGNYMFRKSGLYKYLEKYEKLTAYKILCYHKNGEFFREFKSILEASIILKTDTGNISRNICGKTPYHKDYIFVKYSKNFPLLISKKSRSHKNQLKVIIKDLETKEVFNFESFRKVPNSFISRSVLSKKYKISNKFIFKNKYEIEIIKCK